MKQKLFAQITIVIVLFCICRCAIPAKDYDFLYQASVVAIFGPGTSIAKAACQIMEIMLKD